MSISIATLGMFTPPGTGSISTISGGAIMKEYIEKEKPSIKVLKVTTQDSKPLSNFIKVSINGEIK